MEITDKTMPVCHGTLPEGQIPSTNFSRMHECAQPIHALFANGCFIRKDKFPPITQSQENIEAAATAKKRHPKRNISRWCNFGRASQKELSVFGLYQD